MKYTDAKGEKDWAITLKEQLTVTVQELKDQNLISGGIYEQLQLAGTTVSRLYGLPKIHKSGIPPRPILDMATSPYHLVAHWPVDVLEPVRTEID
ncbi:hypothetical protein FBUS_08868 [Fasciolopsis buskii]|uniref:Uncharacterized protein n=1 Tax=Fasciolopsis buskii TaxID=27845 RepID=A0A8E0VGA2_9TREM|nr:hypothetical protein FBUS_08868 [Fasciolopsis buski]